MFGCNGTELGDEEVLDILKGIMAKRDFYKRSLESAIKETARLRAELDEVRGPDARKGE